MLQATGLQRLVNKTAKHSTEPRPVLDAHKEKGVLSKQYPRFVYSNPAIIMLPAIIHNARYIYDNLATLPVGNSHP